VIVHWTMRATHQAPFWGLPPTGRPFALDGVNIFRVEDEPVVERLSYVDAASLLAQPDPTASAKAAEGDR
jgi:predicted ester cyclase